MTAAGPAAWCRRDAVMFYTSVRRPDTEIGRVRRARPTRAVWNAWHKEDCVVQRPGDVALTAFRDPFVLRDLDRWRMLVGAGRADTTATVVSLGEEQLFIVSVHDRGNLHYVACAVGAYGDGRFEPETWYRLTYGPAPYAASFYRDNQGRPGLIAWLRGIADPGGAGPEP